MEERFENASNMIFFTPRSQYRWIYEIDGGKKHVIHQDNVLRFIKKYIDKKDTPVVSDIMMRHQPFMIMIEERSVIELHKTEDTLAEQSQKLRVEIDNVLKQGNPEKPYVKDNGDERFRSLTENFLKI